MASFSAGTTFTDGVANDVTAAKLGALVNNATPTSGLIQDRTAETITATNDTLLIGDASDSNALKRITVANFAQTLPTAKITTGTIEAATLGTTTGTMATLTGATITNGTIEAASLGTTTGTLATITGATITNGTITTGVIPTLTSGTTTSTAATITTGTISTLTAGTTTSTAATITTGTIPTLVATTRITSGTGTAAAPAIVPTGDTNTGVFFPAADTIGISTQGTEVLRVDSGGKLLVKTDGTNSVFTGSGQISIKDSTSSPFISFHSTDGSRNGFFSINNASTSYLNVEVNQSFALATNNTERVRIDSDGDVSIGTATALSKLHVHGNLTLSNTTTATSAGTGGLSKPATYAGYLTVSINGTSRKIPYYAT